MTTPADADRREVTATGGELGPGRTPQPFDCEMCGDPDCRPRRKPRGTLQQRFERKIEPDPNGGCWLWAGRASPKGYGQFHFDGASHSAHRWAYETFVGPIAEGLLVCHKCDIPACVNPDHLFLGSNADNMADMAAKGRADRKYGARNGNAKLSPTQVRNIRRLSGRILQKDIATQFGVSPKQISNIVRGLCWPEEEMPPEVCCEHCNEPATEDDFIQGLHAVLCSICLERLMDAEQPEQQL